MSNLIGRHQELTALVSRLESAARGQGGVALIAGEPGIGKSSLARLLASSATERGVEVLWGRCAEGGLAPAYTAWAEALRPLLADTSPADPALAMLTGPGDIAIDQTGQGGSQEDAQRQLHSAVTRLLMGRAQDKPLLVVIDDLHWADGPTLDLFHYAGFFAAQGRLLLVGSYRELEPGTYGKLNSVLASLQRESSATVISLRGLSRDEAARLLAALHKEEVPASRAAEIWEQSGGNPFFLTELGRALASSRLERPNEGIDAPTTGSGSTPATVRRAIVHRLGEVGPDTQLLLKHAAIFPGAFDFAPLAALIGLDEARLLDAIDEAAANRWITPVPGVEEQYAFTHPIVRQALLDGWSPSRLARLHRQAAEALAEVAGGLASDCAGEIAYHYLHSRSLPGAAAGVPYALQAAEAAGRRYATDQVVEFLRVARDLTVPGDRMLIEILPKLAVAEAEALMIPASADTGWQAVSLMETYDVPATEIASFLGTLAVALKHRAGADSRVWRPFVERGLSIVDRKRGLVWARLQLTLDPVEPVSRTTIRAGRWRGFDAEAVEIARQQGAEVDQARTYESFDARTLEQTDALVERARGWTQWPAILHALTVAANDYHYRHGAYREAEAIWREIIDVAERSGALAWQAQATNQLTLLFIAAGRFPDAEEMQATAKALLYRLGPGRRPDLFATEMATAQAFYLGGEWAELGRFWAQLADDPSLAPGDTGTLAGPIMAAFATHALVESGERDEAATLVTTLTRILETLPPTAPNQNGAVALAAGVVWNLQQTRLAPVYRTLAQQLIAAGVGDYPQTSLALSLARMAALLDRPDEASEAFGRAREHLTRTGQVPLLAIAGLDEAAWRLARPNPDLGKAKKLLENAERTFRDLAMEPWLRKATAVRANLDRQQGHGQLPAGLTDRELEVLKLVAKGRSDREIADELFISPRTVNAHLRNMFSKTETSNRTELSIWGYGAGLVTLQAGAKVTAET